MKRQPSAPMTYGGFFCRRFGDTTNGTNPPDPPPQVFHSAEKSLHGQSWFVATADTKVISVHYKVISIRSLNELHDVIARHLIMNSARAMNKHVDLQKR
ncbi:hypothetical protein ALC57_07281 [Trachymyrmex cornetzi]|uniref:Uncharacterized protein n=1 Tax=Trachymyrmex cornetzi TaxID=471704 RepID=A0A195E5L3_9HYME|nr:hypothetical protein ALC57_07281 [Trachymyrmex cornetzi]